MSSIELPYGSGGGDCGARIRRALSSMSPGLRADLDEVERLTRRILAGLKYELLFGSHAHTRA